MGRKYPFGHWIKERRKELDLSQAALAFRCSCERETISKIERDGLIPSRDLAKRLVAELVAKENEPDAYIDWARDLKPAPRRSASPPHPIGELEPEDSSSEAGSKEDTSSRARSKGGRSKRVWIGAAAGILVLMLAGMLVAIFGPPRDDAEQWTTSPSDGAVIPQHSLLRVNHPEGVQSDIWVIMHQPNGKYYPMYVSLDTQTCQLVLPPTGGTSFTMPIRVGEDYHRNERFALLITTASRNASQSLISTVEGWCRANSYPGLAQLPEGLVTKRSIIVQREP